MACVTALTIPECGKCKGSAGLSTACEEVCIMIGMNGVQSVCRVGLEIDFIKPVRTSFHMMICEIIIDLPKSISISAVSTYFFLLEKYPCNRTNWNIVGRLYLSVVFVS